MKTRHYVCRMRSPDAYSDTDVDADADADAGADTDGFLFLEKQFNILKKLE